jgi:hypothetical protein
MSLICHLQTARGKVERPKAQAASHNPVAASVAYVFARLARIQCEPNQSQNQTKPNPHPCNVLTLSLAVALTPQGTLVPPHARYGELQLPWWARHHLDVVGVAALLMTVVCLALRSAMLALLGVVSSSVAASLCKARPAPSPAACDEHHTTPCRSIPEHDPVLVWPSDET